MITDLANCPFCNVRADRLISSGELTSTLLSDPRLTPGHCLVVPKRHVEDPSELSDAELLEIFSEIKMIRKQLVKNGAQGCDVRQNFRPFLPESRTKIDHVHFHVIPRYFEDELYKKSMRFEIEVFKDLTLAEQKEFMEILHND